MQSDPSFFENNPSFCAKRAVIFLKTTRRFVQSKPSFTCGFRLVSHSANKMLIG